MPDKIDNHGDRFLLRFVVIWFSVLFAFDLIAPAFLGQIPGDANTKAVLANLVIALVSYMIGRNDGARQQEANISKLIDTAKVQADVQAALAPTPAPADLTVPAGESVTVKAQDAAP